MTRFRLPAEVSALHELLVLPLFSVDDFQTNISVPSARSDISTLFFSPNRLLSSERVVLGLVRERRAFQKYLLTWKDCEVVEIVNPTDVGLFQLHSITSEDPEQRLIHIRAEPNLGIDLDCREVQVIDQGESIEFETQRYRIGSWIFASQNRLLPRKT